MVALSEHGPLEETPLPRLLLELYRGRFDGALKLVRDHVGKSFLFREGVPIFAESNLASESLGVQLLDSGRISRAEHARVSEYVRREDCKEGKALLDLQLLKPRELFLSLKEQLRIRVVECFGWNRGEYFLEPTDTPLERAQPFSADVYSLIQEGIETHWSPERVLTALGDRMTRYPLRTARVSRLQTRLRMDAAVESFVDALDGHHTLWQALQRASTSRALAAAWVLDAVDALRYLEAPRADTPDGSPPPRIEVVVEDAPGARRPAAAPRGAPRSKKAAPPKSEDGRAAALRTEIESKYEALDDLDHYAMLDLEKSADAGAIKRSYLRAAKTYHPDALARAHLPPEVRERAGRVFAEIGRAYSVLSDPARRRQYDESSGSDQATIDADQIARAENLFLKGEVLLRQGNFRGAIEFLGPAVDLWPEEAAYQAALGWALYKKMPSDPEGAKRHLERATDLDPEDAETIFRLSVVLRALGETVAAAALRDRARRIDPKVR